VIEERKKAVPTKSNVDLGILGGMGPRATHYFTEELLTAIEERHHPNKDQDYPNIFVRYACQIPDRTSMLLNDPVQLRDAIAREAQILVELGCPKIVMPCITAHAILDSDLSEFPFIDIRRIVADQTARHFPTATVGILATRGARYSRTIDKFLGTTQNLMVLQDQEEDRLMAFVYDEAKTWNFGKDISILMELASNLRKRGCDVIIAGCSEVEMCLVQHSHGENGVVLPLRVAAKSYAANWSKGEKWPQ